MFGDKYLVVEALYLAGNYDIITILTHLGSSLVYLVSRAFLRRLDSFFVCLKATEQRYITHYFRRQSK